MIKSDKHLFAFAALLAACGSGSTSDFDSFLRARAKAVCQHEVRCGFLDTADEKRCEDAQLQAASGYDASAAIAAKKITFSGSAASKCLDAIGAADCGFGSLATQADVACQTGILTGTVAAGGACAADPECAGGGICGT